METDPEVVFWTDALDAQTEMIADHVSKTGDADSIPEPLLAGFDAILDCLSIAQRQYMDRNPVAIPA